MTQIQGPGQGRFETVSAVNWGDAMGYILDIRLWNTSYDDESRMWVWNRKLNRCRGFGRCCQNNTHSFSHLKGGSFLTLRAPNFTLHSCWKQFSFKSNFDFQLESGREMGFTYGATRWMKWIMIFAHVLQYPARIINKWNAFTSRIIRGNVNDNLIRFMQCVAFFQFSDKLAQFLTV